MRKPLLLDSTPSIDLINGRPIAEPWLVDNVHAIIEAWEPGALGGIALAEILFGRVNPSGKLPITVPYSVRHLRAIYNHKPTDKVRRYADAPNENLFEFGHGLSYTTFEYSNAELSRPVIEVGENTSLSLNVTNVGEVAGQEVVQLYIRDHFSEVTRPVKELNGFKRITLLPNGEQTVHLNIEPKMLSYIGKNMTTRIDAGDFSIMVGGSSRLSDLEVVRLKVMPRGQ